MVRKKASEEKYPRVTITISPVLQSIVTERIRDEGLTLSGVVSELLTGWLDGSVELTRPAQSQITNLSLEQRIEALEQSMQKLIRTDNNRYEPARIDNSYQYESIHTDGIPEQPTEENIQVSGIEPEGADDTNQYESIHIDIDYWQKVCTRYSELKKRYSPKEIFEYTGIPEGTQKKLSPTHKTHLAKPLPEDRYNSLMEMPL